MKKPHRPCGAVGFETCLTFKQAMGLLLD